MYNKVKSFFFRPAGRFRDGLARQISVPLASADGESTGDPPVASLALVPAPWPARRALKVEKNRISFAGHPSGSALPNRRLETRCGKQSSSKKNVQSIPYIYAMNSDLLYDSSRNIPQVDFTPGSHPSIHSCCYCGEHAGSLPVRDDTRCDSIIRVHICNFSGAVPLCTLRAKVQNTQRPGLAAAAKHAWRLPVRDDARCRPCRRAY